MRIEQYAQRLLNPLRGTVNTIRYASAEAVTLDGVHWDIYVSNDALRQNLEGGEQAQISDIRYGHWSAEQGLKRGPLNPSEDFRRMEAMGDVVFEHLLRVHDDVPFDFEDSYELWLLDTDRRPLALLQSAVSPAEIPPDPSTEWRAGFAAREHFLSEAVPPGGGGEAISDYLARYINTRAGRSPSAHWFQRTDDGAGIGLRVIGQSAEHADRWLEASEFPPLFLSRRGHDEAHRRLVDDYLAWQSPWLLLCPHLDTETRRALERHTRRQPQEVYRHYRLYPEIVDDGPIKTALVEAVLRRSQVVDNQSGDSFSTFYIELNPTGGE
jgi:hypothetical protein